MEENRDKGFKIFGDDEPETETIIPLVQEESEPVAAPASSSKAMFVAIFAFCILGALLFFGYFQLSNRINRMESTGTQDIKGLNQEVDARLTHLTGKLSEQNTQLTKQIEALTSQVTTLAKQSEKNASAVSSVEKVLTSTKKSADNTITDVETRLSALIGRLDNIEVAIEKDISRVNTQLDTLGTAIKETRQSVGGVAQIQQDLQKMQLRFNTIAGEIETLQAAKRVEPDEFRQQITSLDQQLNRRIETTEKQLQQTIASIDDEIDALEAMMKSFKSMSQSNPSAGQGDIIEQEIQ